MPHGERGLMRHWLSLARGEASGRPVTAGARCRSPRLLDEALSCVGVTTAELQARGGRASVDDLPSTLARRRAFEIHPNALADDFLGDPQHRISARIPTQGQAQALHLTSSTPVLRTLRVVHGDGDGPVEVTVMVKAAHLYELQYEFDMP